MEQYFKVRGVYSRDVKVTIILMHFVDDAKLYWCSKVNDIQNGACTINSWKYLNKEFFIGIHSEIKITRTKTDREIKRICQVVIYLTLNIKDMLEKDKVYEQTATFIAVERLRGLFVVRPTFKWNKHWSTTPGIDISSLWVKGIRARPKQMEGLSDQTRE